MPSNKKHHFVPRFYLKRFSRDGRSINLYNIPSARKITSANLANQCYRNYFYGKEASIEGALSLAEGEAATVFHLVDTAGFLPPIGSRGHLALVLYVLMQHSRTQDAADSIDEMNDKLAQRLFGAAMADKGIDLSQYKVGLREPASMSLAYATLGFPLMLDLQPVLIRNETSCEFVTSDNPSIFYNQLMSFRSFGSSTGIACKGLQVFLPIAPRLLAFLYDRDVYSVGRRDSEVVVVNDEHDIHELNVLQMCSASQNVYFMDEKFNVEALRRKASSYFRVQKGGMRAFPGKSTGGHRSEFIAIWREDVRTNLALTFVRIRKSARRWRVGFRKLKRQPAAVPRDRQLLEKFQAFREVAKKGEYQLSEFARYLKDTSAQSSGIADGNT